MGKKIISRTRVGTVSFVNELLESTGAAFLETNIIPFPTSNIKKLKSVPAEVSLKVKEIFLRALIEYQPKVIIVHSKTSLLQLLEVLSEKKMISLEELDLDQSQSITTRKTPFMEFTYFNGSKCTIFACRHFMSYRKEEKSFADFREGVIRYLRGEFC